MNFPTFTDGFSHRAIRHRKYHAIHPPGMITDLPPCPVETTLLLISDKWVVLILRDLRTGTKRFNELMRSVTGVSQKVLTEKLRRMEENELVERKVYPEVPPRVEYTLTDRAKTLRPILESLLQWSMHNMDDIMQDRRVLHARPHDNRQ